MKRAFVTGPSGFVGPHLVRELVARGYDVCAFDRPRAGTSKTVFAVAPIRPDGTCIVAEVIVA